jgi:hypothetical protein
MAINLEDLNFNKKLNMQSGTGMSTISSTNSNLCGGAPKAPQFSKLVPIQKQQHKIGYKSSIIRSKINSNFQWHEFHNKCMPDKMSFMNPMTFKKNVQLVDTHFGGASFGLWDQTKYALGSTADAFVEGTEKLIQKAKGLFTS